MSVLRERRYTLSNPCPICGGHDRMPRGSGARCFGFLSGEEEQWAHCTREEYAGGLDYNASSSTYAHKLTGDCRCGTRHDPSSDENGHDSWRARIERTYDYRDTDGKLLFQVVRYYPKGFAQRRPDRPDGWEWNIKGVKRVLYRLPELLASNPEETVYVVEGEKDAEKLASLGLTATTNPQGAKKWREEYTAVLEGRHVAIIPDNDTEGREHAEAVAAALSVVARSVRVVALPDLPQKGDVSDWLNAGGTVEELSRLVEQTQQWRCPTSTILDEDQDDTSNSARVLTATDLMALELPPIAWIVRDILPEGVTLLAGKPKLGKSWMVLGLSIAVANGGVALGKERVEQGEVLYIGLEENWRRIQKRLRILLAGSVEPRGLHFTVDWPRADEGGIEDLDGWIEQHSDTRLVIIDTLARFKPRGTGRRTQYDEDRDAVDPLGPIAAERGVGILLVHHLREAESADPLDMITGSVELTGGVDGALVLKRQRGQADAFLHVEGRDIENPTELALKFDQNAATWSVVGDAEEYRISEGRKTILEVLKNADERLGPTEITERLNARGVDMKCGAVREMLSQMVKDGQVKNLGRGEYVHPDYRQNIPDDADILTNGGNNVR
jgi:hypothetical protein